MILNYAGNEPLVISRGGFSGLFPEGTRDAIALSLGISIFLCNLMLSKDGLPYCITGTTLDNATTIEMIDPKVKTYKIDGKDVQGRFSLDYTADQIDQNVSSEYQSTTFPSMVLCLGNLAIRILLAETRAKPLYCE